MKQTIFRLTFAGLLVAAVLALGAVASFAQDPCTDVAGQTAMQDEFDALYKKGAADLEARQKAIDSGKAFLDKYGNCDSAKPRADWLKEKLPGFEKDLATRKAAIDRQGILKSFDAALQATGSTDATAKAKAYTDAYSIGQQILTKWPDDYRPALIVLATMGGDEALLRNNYKYADETIRYAKMAIADMQAGKSFAIEGKGDPKYGLSLGDQKTGKVIYNFSFKDQNAALGWMNLYVGNILYKNKNDKAGALPYLYASTKYIPSDAPVSFSMIGDYYTDQLAPAVKEINDMIAANQKETDADKIKANNETIKAKVAMANGIAERAMDAYARAYTLSTKADYKANVKSQIDSVFKVRFPTPTTTVDQWIAGTVAKPFVDPTTPIQPISDPEAPKTTAGDATTATPATAKKPRR